MDDEARALFAAGHTAFEDGRFVDALTDFDRAYELSQRPELLYNIGQCHDHLRQDAEALAAFQAYLDVVPDAPLRHVIEARMVVLREQMTPAVSPPAREPVSDRGAAGTDEATPAPSSSADVTTQWWFWAALGGGALILVGIAIGIGVAATSAQQQPLLDGDVGGVVFALEVRP